MQAKGYDVRDKPPVRPATMWWQRMRDPGQPATTNLADFINSLADVIESLPPWR